MPATDTATPAVAKTTAKRVRKPAASKLPDTPVSTGYESDEFLYADLVKMAWMGDKQAKLEVARRKALAPKPAPKVKPNAAARKANLAASVTPEQAAAATLAVETKATESNATTIRVLELLANVDLSSADNSATKIAAAAETTYSRVRRIARENGHLFSAQVKNERTTLTPEQVTELLAVEAKFGSNLGTLARSLRIAVKDQA